MSSMATSIIVLLGLAIGAAILLLVYVFVCVVCWFYWKVFER